MANETSDERAAREQQERERAEFDQIVQKRRSGGALTCKERRTINDMTPECERQLDLEARLEKQAKARKKETEARKKREEAAERTRQYRTSRERTRRSFDKTKQKSANRRAAMKRMASGR